MDIIKLNKDVEPYVIQSIRTSSAFLLKNSAADKPTPLSFVHLSDIHNNPELWDRMVQYVNHYSNYISFAVHTGDYCGGNNSKYTDLYAECTPCARPIYNCTGNHDCVTTANIWSTPCEKSIVHGLLFNHIENWDVCFADCDFPMSYYKDFAESNIRFIVLDLYYDIEKTRAFLKTLLDEALQNGLHVITAMHQPTDYVTETFGATYSHFGRDYEEIFKRYERERTSYAFDQRDQQKYQDIIAAFINNGGNYVCNLAGHDHVDTFGVTADGILNVVVQNATDWDALGDSSRVRGTKSFDCFNVVSVDTYLNLLKIIRIGSNTDHYMRKKDVLCFDYRNKKLLFQA